MYYFSHISTVSSAQDDSFNSTFEFDDLETNDSPPNESIKDVLLNDEHSTSTCTSSSSSELESFRVSVCPFSSCDFIFLTKRFHNYCPLSLPC